MRKIFISNIPFSADDSDLRDFLAERGIQVESAMIIRDAATQRSRGFGFIAISGDDIMTAISRLDGAYMDGRQLQAAPAREQQRFGSRRDDSVGD